MRMLLRKNLPPLTLLPSREDCGGVAAELRRMGPASRPRPSTLAVCPTTRTASLVPTRCSPCSAACPIPPLVPPCPSTPPPDTRLAPSCLLSFLHVPTQPPLFRPVPPCPPLASPHLPLVSPCPALPLFSHLRLPQVLPRPCPPTARPPCDLLRHSPSPPIVLKWRCATAPVQSTSAMQSPMVRLWRW